VRTDELVEALDAYFRVPEVTTDDWAPVFETLYPDQYWRERPSRVAARRT
jgi:hypothetical protein